MNYTKSTPAPSKPVYYVHGTVNLSHFNERVIAEQLKSWLPFDWEVKWTKPPNWDLVLELPQHDVSFGVLIRKDPRLRDFPFGLAQDCSDLMPVLAAPKIPPTLRETLEDRGWGWIDGAGNGWISLPGKLLIDRSGKIPTTRAKPELNLGSAQALQVARVLLHPAHAGRKWTLRGVQAHCLEWEGQANALTPPSLGYLSKLFQFLQEGELVVREGTRGPVRLLNPKRLLRASAEAYSVESIECFSLQTKKQLETGLKKLELESGGYAAWAAFSAADILAPAVKNDKNWMIVAPRFFAELKRILDAAEVENGANITILIPNNDGPFYSGERIGNHAMCTNPVQTYWDLHSCGGRGHDAADALLEQLLIPAWKNVLP